MSAQLDRVRSAQDWWVIRGEGGARWDDFRQRGVVAVGSKVQRFDIDAETDRDTIARAVPDEFRVRELVDFFFELDEGVAVVCPGRNDVAMVGVIDGAAAACANPEEDLWIERPCLWLAGAVLLNAVAVNHIPRTPAGTIFNRSSGAEHFKASLTNYGG